MSCSFWCWRENDLKKLRKTSRRTHFLRCHWAGSGYLWCFCAVSSRNSAKYQPVVMNKGHAQYLRCVNKTLGSGCAAWGGKAIHNYVDRWKLWDMLVWHCLEPSWWLMTDGLIFYVSIGRDERVVSLQQLRWHLLRIKLNCNIGHCRGFVNGCGLFSVIICVFSYFTGFCSISVFLRLDFVRSAGRLWMR